MTREYRIIEEFPDFMINRSGQVRNVHTGHLKLPHYRLGYYQFYKDGQYWNRGGRELLKKTWPEYYRKNVNHRLDTGEYRIVDGFPDYIVNREGDIRNRHSDRPLKPDLKGAVETHLDGKRYHRSVKQLVKKTFQS